MIILSDDSLEHERPFDPARHEARLQSAPSREATRRLKTMQDYQTQHKKLNAVFEDIERSHSWLTTQDSEEAAKLLIDYTEVCASYFLETGRNNHLLTWCQQALPACEKLRQSPHCLQLLLGKAQNALGQWEEAEDSFLKAVALSKQVNDSVIYGEALYTLGRLQFHQSKYEQAIETLEQAKLLNDEYSLHFVSIGIEIATYFMNRRELDKALSLYSMEEERLAHIVNAEETEVYAYALLMIGVVWRKKKQYQKAIKYLEQARAQGTERENNNTIATASHHLAWVHLEQGEVIEAQKLSNEANRLYEKMGDERGSADGYEQLGRIYLVQGKAKKALPFLEKSLAFRYQIGNLHGEAVSLSILSLAHLKTGNIIAAVRYFCKTLLAYQRLGMLSHQRLLLISQEILQWLFKQRGK